MNHRNEPPEKPMARVTDSLMNLETCWICWNHRDATSALL